jgi:hypothetical protein
VTVLHVTSIRDIDEIFEMTAAGDAAWAWKIFIEFSQNQFHISIPPIHIAEEATSCNKNFGYGGNGVPANQDVGIEKEVE